MTSTSVSEVNSAPCGQELLLELHVVLDDPVDHDVDAVVGVEVRVGVLLGDAAVGGPAGVADAGRGRRRGDGDAAADVAPSASSTAARSALRLPTARTDSSRALALDRDARGVIAAVLELLQAGEQDLLHRALSDVADDAAHGPASFRSSPRAPTVRRVAILDAARRSSATDWTVRSGQL